MGELAAVILLYRPNVELLEQLLASVEADGIRVFVFKNGETDPTTDSLLPHTHVISSASNVGIGTALNEMIVHAIRDGFDRILILDQDTTPASGACVELNDRFGMLQRQNAKVAAVGAK